MPLSRRGYGKSALALVRAIYSLKYRKIIYIIYLYSIIFLPIKYFGAKRPELPFWLPAITQHNIPLINEDGELEKLIVEATFHMDDILYAVLHKIDSDEGMIYYVEETDDGSIVLIKVEDEEEIKEVQEMYEGIADDLI